MAFLDVVATDDYFIHIIWMMGVEIEVLSGEGWLTIHG